MRTFKIILVLTVIVALAIVYKTYNPSNYNLFPKCPFLQLTGLKCPGCGSQRCAHHLLNFNISGAAKQNIMAVVFFPYVLLGFIVDASKKKSLLMYNIRTRLYGYHATIVVFIIVVIFGITRNIFGF